MQNSNRLPQLDKPKLPIPTALAWSLLESIIGGKPLEGGAKWIAHSSSHPENDDQILFERLRKRLRQISKGCQLRATTEASILTLARNRLRKVLHEVAPPEHAEWLFAVSENATGPFTVLAAIVSPERPTVAHERLMEFSTAMDQLGADFFLAVEQENFTRARDLLLGPELLDDAYWAGPETEPQYSAASRDALQATTNWGQMIRAAAPMTLNVTLSWLSILDIATLSASRYRMANFSLFHTLITQPSNTQVSPGVLEADRQRIPIANLIRMLEAISAANQLNRAKPNRLKREEKNRGQKAALRTQLKVFKRHDLLSVDRFNLLLGKLQPEAGSHEGEARGPDIYALLLATNLFSLLTPRDGSIPVQGSRRTAPKQIIWFPEIGSSYDRWWRRNRDLLVGDTAGCPRPAWLPR